jgi:hypothetical protein
MCYRYEKTWYVSAPGVARTVPTALFHVTTKAKALLFAELLEQGLDLPWDGDDVVEEMRAYPAAHDGRTAPGAILRLVAGNPVLDKDGTVAQWVSDEDVSDARRGRVKIRETAAGYTERIKVSEIEIGDRISYAYAGYTLPISLRAAGVSATRQYYHLTIRATVLDDGQNMTRHGNNYDEFKDGMRFKVRDASWFNDDTDAQGVLAAGHAPTVEWMTTVLRKPKKASK